MVRGLYIAGSGMMLQRRQMEVITNNIANADTTGYKKDFLVSHSFDQVMIRRINASGTLGGREPFVGSLHLGTQVDQKFIDFANGSLEATDRPTDFALVGDAFFVVQTPDGERYTGNGAFYIDEQGFLVCGAGNFLMGSNGPIQVWGLNFTVNEQGAVLINGQIVDVIRVVSFADNGSLRKQGGSLFSSVEAPMGETNPFLIRQNALETSNVDLAREMVDMLQIYRAYETNQRMISMIDETVGRAVNEIGRLR